MPRAVRVYANPHGACRTIICVLLRSRIAVILIIRDSPVQDQPQLRDKNRLHSHSEFVSVAW